MAFLRPSGHRTSYAWLALALITVGAFAGTAHAAVHGAGPIDPDVVRVSTGHRGGGWAPHLDAAETFESDLCPACCLHSRASLATTEIAPGGLTPALAGLHANHSPAPQRSDRGPSPRAPPLSR